MPQTPLEATDWNKHWSALSGNSWIERWRIHSVWSGYRRLLQKVSLPDHPRILELGAGSGHTSMRLVKAFKGTAALVESNPQAVSFSKELWAKAGLSDRVIHFEGNIFDFSSDEKFDLVHSGGVVEHFHGPDKGRIVEMHVRFVKPGGRIIVVVPVNNFRYACFRGFLKLAGKWIYTDEIPWDCDEVRREFGRHGFAVSCKTTIGHEIGYLLEKQA